MKRAIYIGWVLFILSILSLYHCQKEDLVYTPDFNIAADKPEGLTTDIFTFNVTAKENVPQNEKIHCRWDWNNDSIFDTQFIDDLEVKHRFYKPGDYTVLCEALSISGRKTSQLISVKISQGYSPPKAIIEVKPETGHFKTNFLLDASGSYDDEDSLETLHFRWDFEGDGLWDTQYLNIDSIYHCYEKVGDYNAKLEVMDPTKRVGSSFYNIVVHRTDTCIKPGFIWNSDNGRVSDIFHFDASTSYHQNDPEKSFTYRWLFPNQDYTESSNDPIFDYQFKSVGKKIVVLLVEDEIGLRNTIEKELFVAIENTPPRAKIITPTKYGNIETQFYLNAGESLDDMTPTSKLLFRWDFDGDGNWDTGKSNELEIYHQYTTSGSYTCILEAEDEEGLTDITSFYFEVSHYRYPTGYIKDKRDGKYYGTVKIGDQWWMSENLDYRIDPKMNKPFVQKCYDDNPKNCDLYGSLYAIDFLMRLMNNGDSICPESFHMPSKDELDILIKNIEFPNGMEALRPSGSSGFNSLFSGYIIYDCDRVQGNCYPQYFYHKEINFSTHFISTYHFPNREFPVIYTLNIQKNYSELYPHTTNLKGYYSLRCVKD